MSVINRPELATGYLAMDVECIHAYSVTSHLLSARGNPEGFIVPVKVVLVNDRGGIVYDSFIQFEEDHRVKDMLSQLHGIYEEDIQPANGAQAFSKVQADVKALIKGRHLILHDSHNDLAMMKLSYYGVLDGIGTLDHDTQTLATSKAPALGYTPGLNTCTKKYLNIAIQKGAHKPVEDARAAMALLQLWMPGVCGGRMARSKIQE